jgi:hypothetical protein
MSTRVCMVREATVWKERLACDREEQAVALSPYTRHIIAENGVSS